MWYYYQDSNVIALKITETSAKICPKDMKNRC